MTNKTKMSNLESYQELTIQISTLNLKLDKILSLLNKPELSNQPLEIMSLNDIVKHNEKVAENLFSALMKSDNEKFQEDFK